VSGVYTINVISGGHLCIGRQGVGHQYLREVIGTNWTQGGGPQHERALVDHSELGVRGTHRYVSSGGPQSIGRQESKHQCMDVRGGGHQYVRAVEDTSLSGVMDNTSCEQWWTPVYRTSEELTLVCKSKHLHQYYTVYCTSGGRQQYVRAVVDTII
jgi:hypothetical protein